MPPRSKPIGDAAAAVLRERCVLDEASRRITVGSLDKPLDRKLYAEVDEVLRRLGATWDKKAKAHTFIDPDFPARLAEAVGRGVAPPANPLAFFETPEDVIEIMISLSEITRGDPPRPRVLEPSAGLGAIARYVREVVPSAILRCVELDPVRYSALRKDGFHTWRGDFLAYEATGPRYDYVLMNPPFALEGERHAYAIHVCHAYDAFLAPGGRLVAVTPVGWQSAERGLPAVFRDFVEIHGWAEPLDEDAFTPSGTSVRACLVVLDRPAR